MCYRVSIKASLKDLESEFQAKVQQPEIFKPYYHISGFDKPFLPVLRDPGAIEMLPWKSRDEFNTLNARSETVYEKKSFKNFAENRCLLIITGYFEHRDFQKKKYPYFIRPKQAKFFAVGGIVLDNSLLSVLTTDANPLMEKIHNSASRMPLILPKEKYLTWLRKDLSKEEAMNLMVPLPEEDMEAYTCSKVITARDRNRDCEEALSHVHYPELMDNPMLF